MKIIVVRRCYDETEIQKYCCRKMKKAIKEYSLIFCREKKTIRLCDAYSNSIKVFTYCPYCGEKIESE
jgi:hypothetical protein